MFRIAIVGGGPAGLTLANVLRKSSVAAQLAITIFEAEPSSSGRNSQGGTLDLHHDTGLAAIRKAGLLDEFKKCARYDGDEMFIADKHNTVMVHLSPSRNEKKDIDSKDARPEIDRVDLISILRAGLPDGIIQWDRKLLSCSEDRMLHFKTEDPQEITQGPFDLVVGADGAWSKVRSVLTEVKPKYSGMSGYEFTIEAPSTSCPKLNTMVGKGSYASISDGKMLNAQRMRNGSLKIRSWYTCPEHSAQKALDDLGPSKTLDQIISRYEGWSPELVDFLHQADLETMRIWNCYELPVGSKWEHKQGITLLGDAASLSAPFSGEGVNKAMRDALDLALFIEEELSKSTTATKEDVFPKLDGAIRKYEETMFPRALKLQTKTQYHLQAFFSEQPLSSALPTMIKGITSESESFWVRNIGGSAPVMSLAQAYFWWKGRSGGSIKQ